MELIKRDDFNGFPLDIFGEKQVYFITRKQIGEALEYSNPQKAIDKIHERHKEKLDRLSVTVKLTGTDFKMYDTMLYNLNGVLVICRHSRQPKAEALMDKVYDILQNAVVAQAQIIACQSAKIDRLQGKAERLETNLSNTRANYKAEKAENKRLATIAGLESTKEGRTARTFHDALKMAVVEGGYRLDKMRSQSVDRASRQCIGVYDKEYLYMPLELMQWIHNQYAPDGISCFALRADLEKVGVMVKDALGKSYGRTINGKKENCERIYIKYVDDIISIRL